MNQLEIWSAVSVSPHVEAHASIGLTHLEARLPHELLLLILGWIRVVEVVNKPFSELVRCLLGQIPASLPLLAVPAHAQIPELVHPHIFRVLSIGSRRERRAIEWMGA
jgi:hypothetical protein